MDAISESVDPVAMLSDPDVKSYLITILKNQVLSPEQKYNLLINLFEKEKKARLKIREYVRQAWGREQELSVEQIVYQVSKDFDVWDPETLRSQCEISIRHAIRRLRDSQHEDGGWGYAFRVSSPWGTTHAVNCLCAAKQIEDLGFAVDLDEMIQRGIEYLEHNRWGWSVEAIPEDEIIFVYELSMVIRCYYAVRRFAPAVLLSTELDNVIKMGLDRLSRIQNTKDGSWERARKAKADWEVEQKQPRSFEDAEVGSTSYAILALASTGLSQYRAAVEKGITWLVANQSAEGSWDYTDFQYDFTIHSISKTGDALQALMAAKQVYNLEDQQWDLSINRAYDWLKSEQKPVLDSDNGRVSGWGWLRDQSRHQQDPFFDLENTCITLETLVRNPGPFLPLLSSSAKWLINLQYKEDDPRVQDPKEIGKWDYENTARVASSLIQFYISLKGFSPADLNKV